MKILFVVLVIMPLIYGDNFPCSKLTNRTIGKHWNLIDTFLINYSSRLPPNSDVVLGDYFPTVQPWFNCIRNDSNDLYVTLENLKALYWDYATENITWNHRQRLNVVVNGYPYSITVTTTRNFNSAEGAIICICKGSPPTTTTESSLTCNWGSECRLNHKFPICPSNSEANCGNMLYGLQWSADAVVAYLHGASYRISFENQWSGTVTLGDMRATTSQTAGTLVDLWWFNPVYDVSYYRVNNKNGTTVVSNCTDQCASYVANVFVTQPGGFIPSDFSFNNWFLLTNSSTLVSGKLVTKQPLLVNCLWPVPSFEEAASTFCFEGADFDQCNGAVLNNTVDVIRFNLNFTTNVQSGKGATVFSLNTTGGVTLEISCYNDTVSDSSFSTYGEIPFGVTDGPRYCYVLYNGTALKYLGTLPPSVKEIVISKWGHFYINGYNFFSTFPIDCISFNLTTGDSDVFWTIAYTSYTEALVQVENTAITKVTYCNSYVNNIKCSQLTANLNNGFYPVSSSEVGLVNKSVVLLPSFYTHTIVNITIDLGMKRSGYGQPIASPLSNITLPMQDNNTDVYCIRSDQFSVCVLSTCKSALWDNVFKRNCTDVLEATAVIKTGTCPFSFDKLNNYLTFNKLCFSLSPVGANCKFDVVARTRTNDQVVRSLYVIYEEGDNIVGVPSDNSGLHDLSVLHLDSCTDYNIYGRTGVGIIRQTNRTLLSGLYYTSLSGDLLGFKNVSDGVIYSVTPCDVSAQAAVIDGTVVGAITSINSELLGLTHWTTTPNFYYYSIYNYTNDRIRGTAIDSNDVDCEPVITYSNIGVCKNGALVFINVTHSDGDVQPISTGNVTIPTNFTISVQVEYIQVYTTPVSIDCSRYVCNGNPRCNKLLTQYVSACQTIEQALAMGARLENMEVDSMLFVSENALKLASVEAFNSSEALDPIYKDWPNIGGSWLEGLKYILPSDNSKRQYRSAIEDLLFSKVVTSGLGTVDEDYKRCTGGYDIADLVCAQYYNGIMVLPGVANADKMTMYTASLAGGITLGALGGGAVAIPFALAVQARLNYVALQTDVLNKNQQILASAFNQAIGNITQSFGKVNDAIHQTSRGLATVAKALAKVQDVVNTQGQALSHLTVQLQNNFQAISSSISDIYNRLDELSADAQVDRLITGRLTALNAFVSQTLTRQAEVRASRQLAKDKVNECVRSQSQRFGFCGNGTHLFSLANAAPNGMIFFHTVLLPTAYETVTAWAGICALDGDRTFGLVVKDVQLTLFRNLDDKFYLTPRTMYQPRVATSSDFVQIEGCDVLFVNATVSDLPSIIPDYIDINQTVQDILENFRPNWTVPDLTFDIFNATYLNLTVEIDDLEFRSEKLHNTTVELAILIGNINNTLVNLEWLNRIETYVKWPWYVWLLIGLVVIFCIPLLLFCCCSTGCCGCIGCLGSCCHSICSRRQFENYEPIEKVHVH
uniref:Spike glycoprotein n=1 Tax=Transmissible gastroenteritis virus TaxID=11149 RepID=A0A384V9T3_TGEV|nr:spike protein [Transmissible gastroenteritis virus]